MKQTIQFMTVLMLSLLVTSCADESIVDSNLGTGEMDEEMTASKSNETRLWNGQTAGEIVNLESDEGCSGVPETKAVIMAVGTGRATPIGWFKMEAPVCVTSLDPVMVRPGVGRITTRYGDIIYFDVVGERPGEGECEVLRLGEFKGGTGRFRRAEGSFTNCYARQEEMGTWTVSRSKGLITF